MKWLLLALAVYILYRIITRNRRKSSSTFSNRSGHPYSQNHNNQRRSNKLDQIEDAEFEDITEKEEKN